MESKHFPPFNKTDRPPKSVARTKEFCDRIGNNCRKDCVRYTEEGCIYNLMQEHLNGILYHLEIITNN